MDSAKLAAFCFLCSALESILLFPEMPLFLVLEICDFEIWDLFVDF